MLRYRPHRYGFGNFDNDVLMKMWVIRELQAAYTMPKERIAFKRMMKDFFGSEVSYKRFYQDEITAESERSRQITISTTLSLIVLVNLSAFVIDKPRALRALYDYGDFVYGFRLRKPTCQLALMLFIVFTKEPSLVGFYGPVPSFRIIALWIQEATGISFGVDLIPKDIRENRIITKEKIDLIIYTIEKKISDIRVKKYAIAYLNYYKNRYSATSSIRLIRKCIIRDDFMKNLSPFVRLSKYISQIKNNEGKIPEFLLSEERCEKAIRVSSFNKRITFIDSKIKINFIKELLKSYVKIFKPAEATGALKFINELIRLSHQRHYRKEHILTHRSPSHEAVLPNITYKNSWVIGSEIPVYLDSIENKELFGHIDLLLIIDKTLYVCDYKPDERPLSLYRPSTSFINSIPQVVSYALILKKNYKIENILCITFNKKGAWLYEPQSILRKISYFVKKHKKDIELPWAKEELAL